MAKLLLTKMLSGLHADGLIAGSDKHNPCMHGSYIAAYVAIYPEIYKEDVLFGKINPQFI